MDAVEFLRKKLTPKQLEEFKLAFDLFDSDKDGLITTAEFVHAMRALEHDPNSVVQDVIRRMELQSETGEIQLDFDQFVTMVCRQEASYYSSEDAREDFRQIDVDGDGKITREELKDYFQELGTAHTDEEIDEMILEVDIDRDGTIDFEEFIAMMFHK